MLERIKSFRRAGSNPQIHLLDWGFLIIIKLFEERYTIPCASLTLENIFYTFREQLIYK